MCWRKGLQESGRDILSKLIYFILFFYFSLYIEEAEKIACVRQGASRPRCFVHQPNAVRSTKQEPCSAGLIVVPTSITQYF